MTIPMPRRRLFMLALLALLLPVLARQLVALPAAISAGKTFPPDDFVAYWAAARLQATGGNPYSPAELLAVQRAAGWTHSDALRVFNAPWTLAFLIPFAHESYPVSRTLWLVFSISTLLIAATWLWRFYGGPPTKVWLAWLLACTFGPLLEALRIGQVSPLLLLGITAFLYFQHRRQWWLAGLSTMVLAIKPHVVYLLYLALFLWAIRRRPSVLGGAVLGLAASTAVTLLFGPQALSYYIFSIQHSPPLDWMTPTLGTWLRILTGSTAAWLLFVSSIGGAVWLIVYWIRHRATWDWAEQTPPILLVSATTAAYGWSFDLVVLLPVILQAAARLLTSTAPETFTPDRVGRRLLIVSAIVYLVINAVLLIGNSRPVSHHWTVWLAPTWLACYLLLQKRLQPRRDHR